MLPLCRRDARTLLLAALTLLGCGTALAQPYPGKPLRWIVPFAAGGPLDVITRAIAKPLSDSVGQPVVVENRASAGGIVGIEAAAKQPRPASITNL